MQAVFCMFSYFLSLKCWFKVTSTSLESAMDDNQVGIRGPVLVSCLPPHTFTLAQQRIPMFVVWSHLQCRAETHALSPTWPHWSHHSHHHCNQCHCWAPMMYQTLHTHYFISFSQSLEDGDIIMCPLSHMRKLSLCKFTCLIRVQSALAGPRFILNSLTLMSKLYPASSWGPNLWENGVR